MREPTDLMKQLDRDFAAILGRSPQKPALTEEQMAEGRETSERA